MARRFPMRDAHIDQFRLCVLKPLPVLPGASENSTGVTRNSERILGKRCEFILMGWLSEMRFEFTIVQNQLLNRSIRLKSQSRV